MSRLDELIAELCPNGVVYKRFDEACTLHARIGWQRLTKAEYKVAGDYMLITGTDFTSSNEVNYKSCVYVSKDRYVQDPKIQIKDGDVLITKDGTLGKVAQVNNLPMPATLNGGVFVVRPKDESLLPRYIMHFLLSGHFQKVVEQQKTGSTISHLTQTLFSRLLLPVPPLEVQREIVHILDSFTLLTAELTAELTARKKQYEYYRDNILTFDTTIKHVRLGDICSVITKGTTPKSYTKTGVSFVKTEAFDGAKIIPNKLSYVDEETHTTFLKRSMLEENDILITIAGATIGKCAIVPKEILPANTNQALAIIRLAKGNSPKYVMYLLQSDLMKRYMQKNIKGSAQPNLNLKQLNDFIIPLPPLNVQERLVRVLDNFEAICTDLNIGLPAEIEARQKQYEYYRDKLLSFKGAD